MSEAKKETATPANVPVRFQHQRAGYFRAIHADGVWGALSNTSNIHLSFYNERPPIPNAVIQELGPDGQWVRDTMRTEPPTDVSIVRQFEVDVIMSLGAAKTVHQVLQNFIEMAEQQTRPAGNPI